MCVCVCIVIHKALSGSVHDQPKRSVHIYIYRYNVRLESRELELEEKFMAS